MERRILDAGPARSCSDPPAIAGGPVGVEDGRRIIQLRVGEQMSVDRRSDIRVRVSELSGDHDQRVELTRFR
jgi:hypothetical protein